MTEWMDRQTRTTVQTLQSSVSMINYKGHSNIQWKTKQNQKTPLYGLFGMVARRKYLVSENNIAAWLRVVKLLLNKPQDSATEDQSLARIHSATFGKNQT